MKLFGRVVILRVEATSKKHLDIKIESLNHLLNEHNEFNWGKTYIVKMEDIYDKGVKND